MSSDKFQWSSGDLVFDSPVSKSHLRVIHFQSDGDLPQSIRDKVPDSIGQTIFRMALNESLSSGKSEMHGYLAAYKALESAGYSRDDQDQWVSKQGGPCGMGLPGEPEPNSEDFISRPTVLSTATDQDIEDYMLFLENLTKSNPTSSNVHVNRPLGEQEKEDDPGTQFVNPEQDQLLGATIQNPYDGRDKADEQKDDDPGTQDVDPPHPNYAGAPNYASITSFQGSGNQDPTNMYKDAGYSITPAGSTDPNKFQTDEGKAFWSTRKFDNARQASAKLNSIGKSDVTKVISGSSNIHLNKEGVALASKLGTRIADKGCFDILYSSPLNRGKETAHEILEACPHTTYASPNQALQPWHLGAFEGSD